MKEKKLWQKPALIVLVRSKPEEAVLEGCKQSGSGAPGACWPGHTACPDSDLASS
jgi:hypothetical protein